MITRFITSSQLLPNTQRSVKNILILANTVVLEKNVSPTTNFYAPQHWKNL